MDPVMDVDDLRTEFARRAEQMPAATSTAARMAAVRRRVRARRQRLTGGVVSVAVLGAGAVVLLPGLVDRDGSQTVEPAAPTQTPKGETVVHEEFDGRWPTRIDGNTFLTGRFTEPGDDTAQWTMRVPTLDVSVSLFCHIDRQDFPDAVRDGSVVADFSINGNPVYGTSCGSEGALGSANLLADIDRDMMRSFGVRPGEPFELEMSLERMRVGADRRNTAVPSSKALLGLGLYAQDGEVRQITPGRSLPVVQGRPGDESRLTEFFTVPVARSRTLGPVVTDPSTPAGSSVSYGWAVRGLQGTSRLLKDGRIVEQSTAGGISSNMAIDGQHRLVVRARGGRTEGTLVLGVYEPIDAPYTGSARR